MKNIFIAAVFTTQYCVLNSSFPFDTFSTNSKKLRQAPFVTEKQNLHVRKCPKIN